MIAAVLAAALAACPDPSAGETAADCPWAGVARALEAEAAAGRPVAEALEAAAPGLRRDLARDAARPAWRALWGESLNYDEYARAVIVAPPVLAALASWMAVPYEDRPDRRVHAGLEHVYGYLFSTLKTPFGYKRARWVRGDVERGLGLPEGLLGPEPGAGTQFANATYVLGRIAFRDDPRQSAVLRKGREAAAPALRGFDPASYGIRRLEETAGGVRVRTDFVAFRSTGTWGSHLLVYSYAAPQAGARLLTAFPVQAGFVEAALAPAGLGEGTVKPRYNAVIPGLPPEGAPGARRLVP